MARLQSQARGVASCDDSVCRIGRRVLSAAPKVQIARPDRPLLAELCRGVVSATALSGIFALTFSVTAMIEGSLSQRNLNLPNKCFTKSATELAR